MFIIFINDIKLAVKYSSLNLFADDSTLSYACNNIEDGIKAMNKDLSKIYDWTCANKLSLNVTKTKAMIIASRSKKYAEICEKYKCDFKINDQPIELVDEIKLLGIMIDQHLTFEPHVEYLSRKMLKKFYVLKRCDSRLNCYSKILFYKSLIAPHIDYCSTVLFLLSDPQINDLQKIQNRCMCLILKVNGRTHIKDMLDMLQWNSVKQRIYCNALKFIHRIKQGNVAEALTEKMDTRKEIHKRNLRSNDSFHLPSAKKSSTQNCLMYKGLKMK